MGQSICDQPTDHRPRIFTYYRTMITGKRSKHGTEPMVVPELPQDRKHMAWAISTGTHDRDEMRDGMKLYRLSTRARLMRASPLQ